MAYVFIPAPGPDELLRYVAKWIAQNEQAKVTVEVWKRPTDNYTMEFDYTPKKDDEL